MSRDHWAVLMALSGGPLSRDRVASLAMIPEHVVGRLLDVLMRDSLVGRVPRSSGRPQYGLTGTGRDILWRNSNWRDLDQEADMALRMSGFRVHGAAMSPRPRVPRRHTKRARKSRTAQPSPPPAVPAAPAEGESEENRKVLALLMTGPQTRDRVASEVGVSEHVAGRLLDRLIWDSLVVKVPQATGRPRYGLNKTGQGRRRRISAELKAMARKQPQRAEAAPVRQPAVHDRAPTPVRDRVPEKIRSVLAWASGGRRSQR